jgi:hypothetical protein
MIAEIEQEISTVLSERASSSAGRAQARFALPEISVDEDGIWVGLHLPGTDARSLDFSPFVVDLGAAGWVQGSSDGRRLSVAMSPSMKAAGVAIIAAVLRAEP